MHYVDTSTVVSYYLPEARSARVDELLRSLSGLTISGLTEAEVASAMALRVRRGTTPRQDAVRAFGLFQEHLGGGFYWKCHVISQHYAQAVDILSSFEYTIRVNDAIHVALALLEGYHLYTSDEDMHECALAQGVPSTYVP